MTNLVSFEISDRSLNVYKKYAEDASKFKLTKDQINIPKQKSVTELSVSSYSIISTPPSRPRNPNISFIGLDKPPAVEKSEISKGFERFLLNPLEFTSDPLKQLSEKTLATYLNHLNVGYRGAQEPSENNLKIYESYVQRENSIL